MTESSRLLRDAQALSRCTLPGGMQAFPDAVARLERQAWQARIREAADIHSASSMADTLPEVEAIED